MTAIVDQLQLTADLLEVKRIAVQAIRARLLAAECAEVPNIAEIRRLEGLLRSAMEWNPMKGSK